MKIGDTLMTLTLNDNDEFETDYGIVVNPELLVEMYFISKRYNLIEKYDKDIFKHRIINDQTGN
jgi:hypothetical protein